MKFIIGLIAICAVAAGCGSDNGGTPTAPSPAPTLNVPYATTDLRVGTGTEATTGRQVVVNYSGWIYTQAAPENKGARFDSGTFGPFPAGGNQAIAGFSRAVVGMRVGGLRRVVVPPDLGYGNNPPANSGIRPNETLLFEIELVAVQ